MGCILQVECLGQNWEVISLNCLESWFGMNVEHMGAMDWCVHVSGCLCHNEQRLNEMVMS